MIQTTVENHLLEAVAIVHHIDGEASVYRKEGQLGNISLLNEGDLVYKNDVVSTSSDSTVLMSTEAIPLLLSSLETFQFSPATLNLMSNIFTQASLNSGSTSNVFNELKEALESGKNIESLLEKTNADSNTDDAASKFNNDIVIWPRENSALLPDTDIYQVITRGEINNTLDEAFLFDKPYFISNTEANNDEVSLLEDETLSNIDVLANDTLAFGYSISGFDNTTSNGGVVTLAADNTFSYRPADNFNGNDSFTYTVTGINGQTTIATVNIVVTAVSDGTPDAVDDSYVTLEDQPLLFINPLINDSLTDEATIIAYSTTSANGATITRTSDGTFNYTPVANYNGSDSFTYTIKDSDGQTDTATILINVTPVNDGKPDANNDTIFTAEDTPLALINPLLNDDLLDEAVIIDFQATSLQGATIVLESNGTFTYTPTANYNGLDSFTYTIQDSDGQNDTATITINVTPVSDGTPDAKDDTVTTAEDTTLTLINPLLNDDLSDEAIIIDFQATSLQGVTIVQESDGTFTYIPTANYNGSDSFTYTIQDSDGQTDTATITINVTPVSDGTPDAKDDTVSTIEDTALTLINPLTNDDLPDEATIIDFQTTSQHGATITRESDGTFTYTPTANYNGSDSFTYTIQDSDGQTDTATVTINVTPVSDDTPEANDDMVSTEEDISLTLIDPLINDKLSDEATIISFQATSLQGATVTQNSDGTFTYTPVANYNGVDSFTYTIEDSDGETDTATVTINVMPVSDKPINSIVESVEVSRDGLLNFDSANGYLLTVNDADDNIVQTELSVLHGILNITSSSATILTNNSSNIIISGTQDQINDALSTLQYQPDTGFGGFDNLQIETTDDEGLTDSDNIHIKVQVDPIPVTFNDNIHDVPYATGFTVTQQNAYEVGHPSLETSQSIEGDIEESNASVISSSRLSQGAGAIAQKTVIDTSNSIALDSEHGNVFSLTGLIYLEAGNEYRFAGSRDDALYIELGGHTMVSTTDDSAGYFSTRVSDNNIGITESAFTPTVSGYYTLEAYAANLSGSGELALNLSVNDTDFILSADNFSFFSNAYEIIAAGGIIDSFTPNAGESADGGYFASNSDADIIGVEGQRINLTNFSLTQDPNDTLISLIVTIPDGASLYAATGEEFIASAGNNTIDLITHGWDLTALSLLLPDASGGDLIDIDITAVTQSISLDTVESNVTLTVGILPTDFMGSIDADIALSQAATDDDLLITGSGFDDILVSESTGNTVILGNDGNDQITGNDEDNTLFGGDGDDIITAGAGKDLLFGGLGNDVLTGGSGIDRFVWLEKDGDSSTDQITDFTLGADGDILDLRQLLSGETTETLTDFLHLNGNILAIDTDGDGSGFNDLLIELSGTTPTSLDDLLAHNIIYDQGRTTLRGTTTQDAITGRASDNSTTDEDFYGNGGSDAIWGNGGADRYIVEADDYVEFIPSAENTEPQTLRIKDLFTFGEITGSSEADILNLSEILVGENYNNITNYLNINTDYSPFGGVYLEIDIDGNGSGTDFNIHLQVDNLDIEAELGFTDDTNQLEILQHIIDYGNLVID